MPLIARKKMLALLPPCTCERGAYPPDDEFGRTWWYALSSPCARCWPEADYWLRIGVLIREGTLWL